MRLGAAAIAAAMTWAGAACGPPAPSVFSSPDPSAGGESPIIAMQRARRGARLVFLDERGTRLGDLTQIASVPLRDNSPVWSPDGRWIVFASSRGRADMLHTSLWIIAAELGAEPRRLTSGDVEDRDPAWLPDGSGVVFASNRSGNFDLWRLDLRMSPYGWPVADGSPTQLTDGPRHALHPSPSPDGGRIVYTEADVDGGASELWLWEAGQSRRLTEGPADSTPAWSPDGKRIAFAALVERQIDGAPVDDVDLFVIDASGGNRRRIVDEALALQTHPVWSFDGRWLFATSLYRSVATGKPILSSVTFVDLAESPMTLRALHDPMAVESRANPTLARRALDARALHENPRYADALASAVEQHLIQREQDEPAP
jgi:Tol biopolymer transport system component